jgi:hypothetical protein
MDVSRTTRRYVTSGIYADRCIVQASAGDSGDSFAVIPLNKPGK